VKSNLCTVKKVPILCQQKNDFQLQWRTDSLVVGLNLQRKKLLESGLPTNLCLFPLCLWGTVLRAHVDVSHSVVDSVSAADDCRSFEVCSRDATSCSGTASEQACSHATMRSSDVDALLFRAAGSVDTKAKQSCNKPGEARGLYTHQI